MNTMDYFVYWFPYNHMLYSLVDCPPNPLHRELDFFYSLKKSCHWNPYHHFCSSHRVTSSLDQKKWSVLCENHNQLQIYTTIQHCLFTLSKTSVLKTKKIETAGRFFLIFFFFKCSVQACQGQTFTK